MSELIFGYFYSIFQTKCEEHSIEQAVSSASIQNQLNLLKEISTYTILHSLVVKNLTNHFSLGKFL
jgi:hypothetical protein